MRLFHFYICNILSQEVKEMPWINLGELLKKLFKQRIDPEEVGVYVPEADLAEEKESDNRDDNGMGSLSENPSP